jgi:hypothetical protein
MSRGGDELIVQIQGRLNNELINTSFSTSENPGARTRDNIPIRKRHQTSKIKTGERKAVFNDTETGGIMNDNPAIRTDPEITGGIDTK